MSFRPGDALVEQFFLQPKNEFAVLGVYRWDCAEFDGSSETVNENLVIRHDGAFVRHEMLEAVDTTLLDQRFHIGADRPVLHARVAEAREAGPFDHRLS